MAALISLMRIGAYNCPLCGEELPLLWRAESAPGARARLDIEVDAKPIEDHIAQHLTELDTPKE